MCVNFTVNIQNNCTLFLSIYVAVFRRLVDAFKLLKMNEVYSIIYIYCEMLFMDTSTNSKKAGTYVLLKY